MLFFCSELHVLQINLKICCAALHLLYCFRNTQLYSCYSIHPLEDAVILCFILILLFELAVKVKCYDRQIESAYLRIEPKDHWHVCLYNTCHNHLDVMAFLTCDLILAWEYEIYTLFWLFCRLVGFYFILKNCFWCSVLYNKCVFTLFVGSCQFQSMVKVRVVQTFFITIYAIIAIASPIESSNLFFHVLQCFLE